MTGANNVDYLKAFVPGQMMSMDSMAIPSSFDSQGNPTSGGSK